VTIRRVTEADLEPMERMWRAFSSEASYTPYPANPFEPSLVNEHVALIAEEDSLAVGTVYANVSSPSFGFVFGLYVVPEARRKGVARRLMSEVAHVLRDQGKSHVVLSVDTPNTGARWFYAGLGFEDAARTLRVAVEQLLVQRG
jgi:ribosomal protein S18 acetylase RimI-like enzyme